MWLFTKTGFLSVVADERRRGVLVVRARIREDLERVVAQLPGAARPPIEETPVRDYRWRCCVGARAFGEWLGRQALAIDYPNFKAAVHGERDRDRAYEQIWAAMCKLQDGRR